MLKGICHLHYFVLAGGGVGDQNVGHRADNLAVLQEG